MRLIYQIQNSWKSFEQHPKISWLFSFFWLSLIGFFAFIFNLGATGLVDETEPLFAEAARQMAETGDWITPYFNGETRFDKPPLVYWLMAIGYKVIGVNEWAVARALDFSSQFTPKHYLSGSKGLKHSL